MGSDDNRSRAAGKTDLVHFPKDGSESGHQRITFLCQQRVTRLSSL